VVRAVEHTAPHLEVVLHQLGHYTKLAILRSGWVISWIVDWAVQQSGLHWGLSNTLLRTGIWIVFGQLLPVIIIRGLLRLICWPCTRATHSRPSQPATRGGEQTPLTAEQRDRAVRNWQKLVKRVVRHLKLRVKWSALGRYLDQPALLALTSGLDRVKGKLVRTAPAETAIERKVALAASKAIARAKARLVSKQ
jgi:hypothetical protein